MNTTRLRKLIQKYGPLGYLMVGLIFLTQWLIAKHRLKFIASFIVLPGLAGVLLTWHALSAHRSISDRQELSHEAQSYTIIDLGVVPGYDLSIGYGINGQGRTTGILSDGEGEKVHAFYAGTKGKINDIGTPGSLFSMGVALNDSLQIAGIADTSEETIHGFVWQDGKFTHLKPLPGGEFSVASSINNKGVVVGGSDKSDGTLHAAGWQNGNVGDLGNTCPGVLNFAMGINDSNEVIGIYTEDGETINSFYWKNREAKPLPTLGGNVTLATAISNTGSLVGFGNLHKSNGAYSRRFWKLEKQKAIGKSRWGDTWIGRMVSKGDPTALGNAIYAQDEDELRGFILQPGGKPADLGTLGGRYVLPQSINSKGTVVGMAETRDGILHAFIWEKGKIQDLNRLLPNDSSAASRWMLITATGVNENGQIVGTGLISGKFHAFLLSPK